MSVVNWNPEAAVKNAAGTTGIVHFVECSVLHGQIREHIVVLWAFWDVTYCLHLQGYDEPSQVPRMASYLERRKREIAEYRESPEGEERKAKTS